MHLIPFPTSICKQSSPSPSRPDGREAVWKALAGMDTLGITLLTAVKTVHDLQAMDGSALLLASIYLG
jgi:hypothetical protein